MDMLQTTYSLKCHVRYIHRVGNVLRHRDLLRNGLRSKNKAISKGQQMNGLLFTQSPFHLGTKDQSNLLSWGNQVRKGAFSSRVCFSEVIKTVLNVTEEAKTPMSPQKVEDIH